MAETMEPAGADAYRSLWRRLRWVYVSVIAADVLAGLVTGLAAPSLFMAFVLALLVVVIVTAVGCAAHVSIGWRTSVPHGAVAIEAVLAGLLVAVVGGGALLLALERSFDGRVDRTKSVGNAVIEEVRAYKVTHGQWPTTLAAAGIDPARLSSGPFELNWEDSGFRDANGDRVPSVRFARHPGLVGKTYRRADQDAWTVFND